MKAFVDLSEGRRMGRIVKMNTKTCWVKIMIGAKSSITIKRHLDKHHVMVYG